MIDSNSFSGFVFYLVIVSPILGWFLKSGRFSRTMGVTYSIGFLVALASINIAIQISHQNDNFYQILGVYRDSSLAEIKRAYRSRSVELHPDRNPSLHAAEEFNRLRIAFDVLSDADKKKEYDLFGEKASLNMNDKKDSVSDLVSVLSFYVVWGIMAFMLTLGDSIGHSRCWTYLGGLLVLILELNIRFAKYELPMNIFRQTTNHEFVLLLQSILPAYMNGCRTLGSFLHFNLEQANFQLGLELLKSNKELQLMIHQLHVDVASRGRRGGPEFSQTEKPNDLPATRSKFNKSKGTAIVPPPIPSLDETLNSVAPTAAPQWKVPSFVWVIAFYAIMNWIFK